MLTLASPDRFLSPAAPHDLLRRHQSQGRPGRHRRHAGDVRHRLYLIYPQGNWVEVDSGTPYQIIGASGYGKPVLDRTLKYEDSLRFALKVGCLAFDSTRISAANVDFPLDVVLYLRDRYQMIE